MYLKNGIVNFVKIKLKRKKKEKNYKLWVIIMDSFIYLLFG